MRDGRLLLVLIFLAGAPVAALAAVPSLDQPIVEIARKIASTSDEIDRSELAEQLVRMATELGPKDIDASTVDAIAALLDNSDDWVRLNAAGALTLIGPSAHSAIPALERALDRLGEEDKAFAREHGGLPNFFGGLNSGYSICQALQSVGSRSVRYDCATKYLPPN